jgi:hypothetical protein
MSTIETVPDIYGYVKRMVDDEYASHFFAEISIEGTVGNLKGPSSQNQPPLAPTIPLQH